MSRHERAKTARRVIINRRMAALKAKIETSLRDYPDDFEGREDLWQRRESLRFDLHNL